MQDLIKQLQPSKSNARAPIPGMHLSKDMPPLPPTDLAQRRVSRKAAPAVTPSVIRSVQGSPDAQHLSPGRPQRGDERADSVMRLSPSLQNIVDEAVNVDGRQPAGLQVPQRDAAGPGETTIKYNNALAEVRPSGSHVCLR
jgi:hypothetical protein